MRPIHPFPGVVNTTSPQKKRQSTMSSSTVVYCNACPAGNKTLKRVECVYHLTCPRIKLADLFCSHSTAQVLLWRFRAVPIKFFNLFSHQDERESLAELTHALFCCDWWPERFPPGERFHPPSGSRQPPGRVELSIVV